MSAGRLPLPSPASQKLTHTREGGLQDKTAKNQTKRDSESKQASKAKLSAAASPSRLLPPPARLSVPSTAQHASSPFPFHSHLLLLLLVIYSYQPIPHARLHTSITFPLPQSLPCSYPKNKKSLFLATQAQAQQLLS